MEELVSPLDVISRGGIKGLVGLIQVKDGVILMASMAGILMSRHIVAVLSAHCGEILELSNFDFCTIEFVHTHRYRPMDYCAFQLASLHVCMLACLSGHEPL